MIQDESMWGPVLTEQLHSYFSQSPLFHFIPRPQQHPVVSVVSSIWEPTILSSQQAKRPLPSPVSLPLPPVDWDTVTLTRAPPGRDIVHRKAFYTCLVRAQCLWPECKVTLL